MKLDGSGVVTGEPGVNVAPSIFPSEVKTAMGMDVSLVKVTPVAEKTAVRPAKSRVPPYPLLAVELPVVQYNPSNGESVLLGMAAD